jgi:hypothetical protein
LRPRANPSHIQLRPKLQAPENASSAGKGVRTLFQVTGRNTALV